MNAKNDTAGKHPLAQGSSATDSSHTSVSASTSTSASAGEVVSDYWVERLAAGDLSSERAEAVRARLLAGPEGRARLERVEASNAEILRAHPPSQMAAEIERRFGRAAAEGVAARASARAVRPGFRLHFGLPALAAAAVALILVVRGGAFGPGQHGQPSQDVGPVTGSADDGERVKGLRPSLRVYRKAAGKVERLQDGATTRAGDELQLAYVAAGRQYGAVASVDGTGHVTYHLPAAPGPAVHLSADGETALPSSYELDAAPGFERFVFLSGDQPFDASVLADVASGRAAAPPDIKAVVFTVRKP